jgi:hypothetical protein
MVPILGDMETHSHSYTFAHNMKLELQFVYLIQNTSEIRETIFFFFLIWTYIWFSQFSGC